MAFDQFYAIDSTSQIEVALRSSTTGQLLTGVAYGSMTIKYVREGSNTQTTVSVVTASQGTFTSGGWVETGITGVYQFGIPNAALVAGAKAVTLVFSASGAIDVVKRIVLVTEDLRDVTIASRSASGEAPTEAEIIAAMNADPPGVNVTQLKGQDAPVDNLVLALGNDDGIVAHPQGIADALALAPTPGDPAAGSVNKHLDDLLTNTALTGTYSYSNTVDDGSGNLLDGVLVQCATDSGFTNVVHSTYTNASGAFTVYSDTAGTHYLRLQLGGYTFATQTVTLA
jgi:hypothetical protein